MNKKNVPQPTINLQPLINVRLFKSRLLEKLMFIGRKSKKKDTKYNIYITTNPDGTVSITKPIAVATNPDKGFKPMKPTKTSKRRIIQAEAILD